MYMEQLSQLLLCDMYFTTRQKIWLSDPQLKCFSLNMEPQNKHPFDKCRRFIRIYLLTISTITALNLNWISWIIFFAQGFRKQCQTHLSFYNSLVPKLCQFKTFFYLIKKESGQITLTFLHTTEPLDTTCALDNIIS